MYYGTGNYEAFAHARRPQGVDDKTAYLVGAGLASLAAAAFLVRDAGMDGSRIHILERDERPGGALDGWYYPDLGFTLRGGREMGHHYECFWDLFRDIPAAEDPSVSALDYYMWLNKDDPDYTLCRATKDRGRDAHTDGRFDLPDRGALELARLFVTPDEDLFYKRIDEVLGTDVLDSTFWMYWRTMFAFENWHSALELKRYLQRFVHHVGGLPDFSALRFTRYNQYESLVVPLVDWLTARGVQFHYGVAVHNVLFDQTRAEPGSPELPPRRRAVAIELHDRSGTLTDIQLTPNDLVFITNGSLVSHSSFGSQNDPAAFDTSTGPGDCWSLWRNIAAQDPHLGDPEVFCGNPELSSWMSATVTTLDDRIPPYIQAVCRRDPFSGRTVTGGIVTVTDSNWLLSWTVNRQPQFRDQPPGTLTVWLYSLFTDRAGNYVRKPMRDCTGAEICAEWLYHLGVPTAQIDDLAARAANTVPCMMPYVTAFFMPRSNTDRPPVVPDHAENFAFIGQFAETPRDTIFTMEYAVRTAMEAVYTLLGVDRAVPEVWASAYDVRDLMNAAFRLRDNRPLKTLKLPPAEHLALKAALDKAKGTDIYLLLEQYGLVSGEDADPQIM